MTNYIVTLSDGTEINPTFLAREFDRYGLVAILDAARKTRAYKAAVKATDATIRSITCPDGEVVTQF